MADVELRHIRYFLAAAEHGSLRRAADSLGVMHAALSHRLRDLEEEVGVSLFLRSNKGVKLTRAGDEFLRRMRRAVAEIQGAFDLAHAAGQVETGEVRIGLFSSLASGFLPDLIGEYERDNPDIRVDLFQDAALSHIAAVLSGTLDVAFLSGHSDIHGCRQEVLWHEDVFVALPSGHELATSETLTWERLSDSLFIVSAMAAGRELHDYIAAQIMPFRQKPLIEHCDLHHDNLLPAVAMGRGIAIVGEALTAVKFPGIIYRPVGGARVEFSAVWNPANENPALRRMLLMARMMARERKAAVSDEHL